MYPIPVYRISGHPLFVTRRIYQMSCFTILLKIVFILLGTLWCGVNKGVLGVNKVQVLVSLLLTYDYVNPLWTAVHIYNVMTIDIHTTVPPDIYAVIPPDIYTVIRGGGCRSHRVDLGCARS